MKRVGSFSIFRWISIGLIAAAVVLTVFQLVVFSRLRTTFTTGTKIAGVDVTGLTMEQAASRVTQAYSYPVELHYGENIIQVKPSTLGFSLNLTAIMTAADQARAAQPFWPSFFAYLFNQLPPSAEVPLRADIDEDRIREYLENEIAARYDQQAAMYEPVPGSVNFTSGDPGQTLDVDRSVDLVVNALRSPTARVVNLALEQGSVARPSLQTLRVLLRQIVDVNEFTGEVEIYLQDLSNGAELQLAYRNGEVLTPGIAFSADSTIKIAIMVAAYREIPEPASAEITQLVQDMIAKSDNTSTDALMSLCWILPLDLGVTRTVREIGLQSTFLDGMFYVGAPCLRGICHSGKFPSGCEHGSRPYNQTTPADIGVLLSDIINARRMMAVP